MAQLAGGGTDAGIVDQDYLALDGERIGERGVPIVQIAAEVLEHHQRQLGRASKAPVGELDARSLDGQCLCGVVVGAALTAFPSGT